MSDLTAFLLARIAEDEAVARAASDGPWSYEVDQGEGAILRAEPHPESVRSLDNGYDLSSRYVAQTSYDDQSGTTYNSHNDGEHIARHDPARVLRECEAKRRIVEGWPDPFGEWSAEQADAARSVKDAALRALATAYSDHPDYDESWKP